jgi:hypothetical protein
MEGELSAVWGTGDRTVALEDVTTIRERLANTPRRIARDKARRTQINHMLASIAA